MFVTTRMQKTKQIVHNPISDEAYGLLGERHEGLTFEGFKDKMLQGPLKRWLSAAGITKKITFHCTRHSFGSLHVEMGTDMAVIQACLGHKNITTTQIYSEDGCTTDVRGGGQDNPETQGSIGLVSGYSGGAVIACRL